MTCIQNVGDICHGHYSGFIDTSIHRDYSAIASFGDPVRKAGAQSYRSKGAWPYDSGIAEDNA